MLLVQGKECHVYTVEDGETVRDVRMRVAEAEGSLKDDFVLTFDGLKISDSQRVCDLQSPQNNEESTILLHVTYVALLGGKGGFGANLRTLAKQKGKKQTTNFGACRDLSGRRLRHVNDEILLRKWQESQQKGEAFRPTQETASGIDLWFLSTPHWAEKVKVDKHKRHREERYKRDLCRDWKRARESGRVPANAGKHWGCPRGAKCQFAHGNELKGEGLQRALEEQREADARKLQEKREAFMRPLESAQKDEFELEDLVLAGLRQAKKNRLSAPATGLAATTTTAASSKSTDAKMGAIASSSSAKLAESAVTPTSTSTSTSAALEGKPPAANNNGPFELVSGQALVARSEEDSYLITGASRFCTLALPALAVQDGAWFFELRLLSDGLMQLGWICDGFRCVEEGDGVGDDASSWAYDGYRQQVWSNGESKAYGPQTGDIWQAGDLVTCCIHIYGIDEEEGGGVADKKVEVSYMRNNVWMGPAYTFPYTGDSVAFCPALSLEANEAVELVKRSSQFQSVLPDPIYLPVYHSLD